jgi:uncharacterized membrane protein YphA (DoxX/SURF4 family)
MGHAKQYISFTIRLFLGSLFIISGISKILDINYTKLAIQNFDIIPISWIPFFAYLLLLTETLLGLVLILGLNIKISSFSIIILLSMFSIAVFQNLIRGESFDCGCFQLLFKDKISIITILRNFLLSILALLLIYEKKHIFTVLNLRKRYKGDDYV